VTLSMLNGEPVVITAGAEMLGESLDAQAVRRVPVDWRPPLPGSAEALVLKGHRFEDYELAVSARAARSHEGCGYAILPAARAGDPGPRLAVERGASGWELVWSDASGQRRHPLPDAFDATEPHLWRLRRTGAQLAVAWEGRPIGTFDVAPGAVSVGLASLLAGAAFDMVRLTAR